MKTTNNVQKTENKKFGNRIIKTFAVAATFVFISFSVGANGIYKHSQQNNSIAQMNTIAEGNSEMSGNVIAIETSVEKSLQIESWMINKNNFGSQVTVITEEMEKPLKVEDWMLANQNFVKTMSTNDTEIALSVESWMLDKSIWGK